MVFQDCLWMSVWLVNNSEPGWCRSSPLVMRNIWGWLEGMDLGVAQPEQSKLSFRLVIGDWWTVSFTIHLVLFCRECVENGQKIHFSCLAALILAPEFNSFHSKSTSSSILKSWWFVNQQLLSLKQTHSPQPGLLGSGSSEVTNEPSPWGQRWSNGWYGYLSQN